MGRPSLQVFTFKKGLLARFGHELCFDLPRFRIELDAGSVQVEVTLSAIELRGAVKDGELAPALLGASDREEILRTTRGEVLQVDRYPQARFEGRVQRVEAGRFTVEGPLELLGMRRPADAAVWVQEHSLHLEAYLVPSLWGITPHRALGGAIQLQDRVVVRGELPRDVDGLSLQDWEAARCSWRSA